MTLSSRHERPARYTRDFIDNSQKKVRLEVDALDPLTEIFLIDWNLKRVPEAYGIGHLTIEVPPGLYKVRFRTATTVHDELVEASAAVSPLRVSAPQLLEFSSPLPLPGRDASTSERTRFVEHKSRELTERIGLGSQIFLCVRAWDSPPSPRGDERLRVEYAADLKSARGNPGRGLTLYSLGRGRTIIDLKMARHHYAAHRLACANVVVEPGNYLLRAQTGAIGVIEIPLFACEGWQTAVFVQSRPLLFGKRTTWLPDISQASIVMFRIGHEWHLDQPDMRLSEQAKWALRQSHSLVSGSQVEQMLHGKWVNPMLGIVGLHLLLMKESRTWDLIGRVLSRLYGLIGPHPDVTALSLAVPPEHRRRMSVEVQTVDFSFPPMLERSWQQVLHSTKEGSALIPSGSFSDSILEELPRGTLWLYWRRTHNSTRLDRATASLRQAPSYDVDTENPVAEAQEHLNETVAYGTTTTREPRENDDAIVEPKSLAEVERKARSVIVAYQSAVQEIQKRLDDPLATPLNDSQARDLSRNLASTYRTVQDSFRAATSLAEHQGMPISADLSSLIQDVRLNHADNKRRLSHRREQTIKSPLEHLVKSWQQLYGELTPEMLKQLSETSGLPYSTVSRVNERVRRKNLSSRAAESS